MKESYKKGVAIHLDPDHARAAATTLTKRWIGAYAGWVSRSCELRNPHSRVPTASGGTEGNTDMCINASAWTALRSRRPHACIETSRARTERPRCCPCPVEHGPLGERDER